jgi:hypothetical protein
MKKILFKNIRKGDYIMNRVMYLDEPTKFIKIYCEVNGVKNKGATRMLISNFFLLIEEGNKRIVRVENHMMNKGVFYKFTKKEYFKLLGKDIILESL